MMRSSSFSGSNLEKSRKTRICDNLHQAWLKGGKPPAILKKGEIEGCEWARKTLATNVPGRRVNFRRRATRGGRRKTRKKRGGVWRTVSDGDTNLETTVEILRRMIREQQRVRISSEARNVAGHFRVPYEGCVNRVWVVDPAEDDPSIIGLIVPEYYIPYAGQPNRAPCGHGGPYSGEYFHRPIKIELWEEPILEQPKRPKSARKTSGKRSKKKDEKKGIYLPLTLVGGKRRKTRKKRGGAPFGDFIVGDIVQLTPAGIEFYRALITARMVHNDAGRPPFKSAQA